MPNGINYDIVRFLTHALVNVNVHSHFQQIHLTWLFLVCFSVILFAPFAIHAALVQITSRTSYIHASYAYASMLWNGFNANKFTQWLNHTFELQFLITVLFCGTLLDSNVVFYDHNEEKKKIMFTIWVQGNFKVFCLKFPHTSNIKVFNFESSLLLDDFCWTSSNIFSGSFRSMAFLRTI